MLLVDYYGAAWGQDGQRAFDLGFDVGVASALNTDRSRPVNPIPTVGVSFPGASAMIQELQAGREVHLFWPGSGPLVGYC